MEVMRRLLLLLALVLAATAAPATASAGAPCRNTIYNDWYKDGKIASTYSIGCYRDAIKHVKGDARIYSSLIDDIHAAMQAAVSRERGKKAVPAQVGGGIRKDDTAAVDDDVLVDSRAPGSTDSGGRKSTASSDDTTTVAAAPVADASDGGIPVPLLVLGGLALALAAAGGVGMVARHRHPRG
jgi:hypothetical protein